MTTSTFDIIIIGSGIAGASAGAWLSETHRVCVLERESQPGHHATGRSAALFSEIYGNGTIRALSRASRSFFLAPPSGFAEHPLVSARGALHIARADQLESINAFAALPDVMSATRRIGGTAARELSPLLRPGYVAEAIHEPEAYDIDVHGLHTGFLRAIRGNHGSIVTGAEVLELRPMHSQGWRVQTNVGTFEARIVVNASGAWADEIARLADVPGIGIAPLRRTAVIVDVPEGLQIGNSPLTLDIDIRPFTRNRGTQLRRLPARRTNSKDRPRRKTKRQPPHHARGAAAGNPRKPCSDCVPDFSRPMLCLGANRASIRSI